MSRATLEGWKCRLADRWDRPERATPPASAADRAVAMLGSVDGALFERLERRHLRRFAADVARRVQPLRELDLAGLRQHAAALRRTLQRQGLTPQLSAECFALASEASARTLGKRPYPVQLQGGYGLLRGRMIEMATGEGKTLTAMLPALALALAGVPVHVVTVNDYLARRDAAYVRPVLELFGFQVGVVTHEEDDEARRRAYAADITYCVNKDLVFDYLRDGLLPPAQAGERKQRGLYYALVDEADGILADEARTPLVIARERRSDEERRNAELALRLARMLGPGHFVRVDAGRRYELTAAGRELLGRQDEVLGDPAWRLARMREERVEQALCALYAYQRGEQYVVVDGKVQIVDEFTGRILPDRSWERGLHQAIELKEGLDLTAPRETIARQTYPEFFARYLRIGCMTGTGREIAAEVRANLGMRFVAIPTHRKRQRRFLGVRLLPTSEQRWEEVAARAAKLAAQGRAVLIGTRSVLASEQVGAVLARHGQAHRVLNALQDGVEAQIIAAAGQPGCVTVATNMAGRGTDIELAPEVRATGGLHVILTEFHESSRIDRQLYGRAGRQGDPGSCEAIVSLDDELFLQFAPLLVRCLRCYAAARSELPSWSGALLAKVAQQRAERKNAGIRRHANSRDAALRRTLAFTGTTT